MFLKNIVTDRCNEQLVGVAEQGDRSKALRNGWVLPGLQ